MASPRAQTGRPTMISEISCLSCNDLQGLRLPTVLCYVLCLAFIGGFDSHTLPPEQGTYRTHIPFHIPLTASPATFEAARAISSVTTSPYTFIVVRMSAWRISFCCTAIGVPTASSHDRYVCLRLCVLTCAARAADAAFLYASFTLSADHGKRPSCAGEAKIQSSCAEN
jgi:hypothetical protein